MIFFSSLFEHGGEGAISAARHPLLLDQRSQQKDCASFLEVPGKVLGRAPEFIFQIYKEFLQIEKIKKKTDKEIGKG